MVCGRMQMWCRYMESVLSLKITLGLFSERKFCVIRIICDEGVYISKPDAALFISVKCCTDCFTSPVSLPRWYTSQQTRLFLFHYEPRVTHVPSYRRVVAGVEIIFRGGSVWSATTEVSLRGTEGHLSNVILAVNRTLREAVIAYEWESTETWEQPLVNPSV